MKLRTGLVLLLLPLAAFGQTSADISFQNTFLLRNSSGTAANPGSTPRQAILFGGDTWTAFAEGALFATHVSEYGPEDATQEFFSTNWLTAGAQRSMGNRGLFLFRVRASAEPGTVKEEGYPQLLQHVSAENGGPLRDHMRGQPAISEAAVHAAFRMTNASFVHLYAAPIGDPALGPVPYGQRTSAMEFAEAPFAYDIQETFHEATRVVTAGYAARALSVEASMFHAATGAGRRTTIEDGDIDSWSARATLALSPNFSLQASRGLLGDAELEVTSGSASFGSDNIAATALWTRREVTPDVALTALGFELTARLGRHYLLGRYENVDTPLGTGLTEIPRRTHTTIGYMADLFRPASWRVALGVNIDYHSNYRQLGEEYGHKPQSIYGYVRLRTQASRR